MQKACAFLVKGMPKGKSNIEQELVKFRSDGDKVLSEIQMEMSQPYANIQQTSSSIAGQSRPRAPVRRSIPLQPGQQNINKMFKKT